MNLTFKDRILLTIKNQILMSLSPEFKENLKLACNTYAPYVVKKVSYEEFHGVPYPIYTPDIYAFGLVINHGHVVKVNTYTSLTQLADSHNDVIIGVGESSKL